MIPPDRPNRPNGFEFPDDWKLAVNDEPPEKDWEWDYGAPLYARPILNQVVFQVMAGKYEGNPVNFPDKVEFIWKNWPILVRCAGKTKIKNGVVVNMLRARHLTPMQQEYWNSFARGISFSQALYGRILKQGVELLDMHHEEALATGDKAQTQAWVAASDVVRKMTGIDAPEKVDLRTQSVREVSADELFLARKRALAQLESGEDSEGEEE